MYGVMTPFWSVIALLSDDSKECSKQGYNKCNE